MAASKNNDMYSYLDQLSTQELESLLQKDAEAPDGGDLDMVMYIMEVIEKREGGSDKEKAAAALEDFFSTYATPEGEGLQLYPSGEAESIHVSLEPEKASHGKRSHKTILRKALLIAAALACALVLAACSVGGFARFFQMVGKWTSEVFTFENAYKGKIPQEIGTNALQPQEDVQYSRIEDALAAYGITEKVVPTKLPEGLEIETVEVIPFESNNSVNFCALYQSDTNYLMLQVRQLADQHDEKFEKSEGEVTKYTRDGIVYYFYMNMDSNCVTWFNGNLECSIGTDLPEGELTFIVDSIYER